MSSMAQAMAAAADHENNSWRVIVATAFGFSIATTAIALRLVSRWLCRKRLEANDYLILSAYPFKLGIDIASVLRELLPASL